MAITVDADEDRKEKEEEDVSPHAGNAVNDAYDLTLYMAKDSETDGVLIVHMNLHFLFEDGEGEDGETLTWTQKEKKKFVKDFERAVWDIWTEAFTIRTDSSIIKIKEVEVQFEFKTQIDGVWIYDHWELEVTKVDKFTTSVVYRNIGNVTLDSEDPYYTHKPNQRAAAHEFGHMMGLKDEYLDKEGNPKQNPHWTSDTKSIMFSGEEARARHFTPFAYWLTEQYEVVSTLSGKDIIFYVDDGIGGKWTVDGGTGFKKAKLK